MAGGVLKTFGGLFLAIGIVGLVGGLGAVAYGFFDEKDNQDSSGPLGVGHDGRRADTNEQLLVGGAVGAGLGLLMTLLGIILLAIGGSRSRRELVNAVAQRGDTPAAWTRGAGASPASSASGPPLTAPGPGSHGSAQPASSGRRNAMVALSVLSLLVVSTVAVLTWEGGGLGGGPAALPTAGEKVASTTARGSVAAGFTVGGSSQMTDSSPALLEAPAGTVRLEVQVAWEPGDLCCTLMEFYVERMVGEAWQEVSKFTGASGVAANVTLDGAAADLRLRGFPAEDGVSEGQAFEVTATFWTE